MKAAILVDGGYYRKIAPSAFDCSDPKVASADLVNYCMRHLKDKRGEFDLYRIFYYDCPPLSENVYHPFLKKTINMRKTDQYQWMTEFLKELTKKRKLALRLGRLSEWEAAFTLRHDKVKKLMAGSITLDDLTERDFAFTCRQKGVDMKIAVDIASLAFKKQVDKIILIAGDSDFVPAAKLARREGIDFVLDPLGRKVKEDLFEHIDGLRTCNIKLKQKRS